MIKSELGDAYFMDVESHLHTLEFRRGTLVSAQMGTNNKGIHYVLRKVEGKNQNWLQSLFEKKPSSFTFNIDPRNESGSRALAEVNDEGLNFVANTLAQSTDHILDFFHALRAELAFYIGSVNLQEQLEEIGGSCSFPVCADSEERQHTFIGLYDVCLALSLKQKIVANELEADNKELMIITGANQGGKSTFLRSIGVSQLMAQSGMFVPAYQFRANICNALFTHFKRREDATMNSGKLDEELSRMSEIANYLTPNSMLLFNESFAATNEREGSEIAGQIVSALSEKHIKVFFVTHLYEFAHNVDKQNKGNALFLRAERQADTSRTFKNIRGEPLQSSFGVDLYNRIFG